MLNKEQNNDLKKLIKKSLINEHMLPQFETMYEQVKIYIAKYGIKDFLSDILSTIENEYPKKDNMNQGVPEYNYNELHNLSTAIHTISLIINK